MYERHMNCGEMIEYEKAIKAKYYDQQIKHEQDEIRRHTKLIDELKRQF